MPNEKKVKLSGAAYKKNRQDILFIRCNFKFYLSIKIFF